MYFFYSNVLNYSHNTNNFISNIYGMTILTKKITNIAKVYRINGAANAQSSRHNILIFGTKIFLTYTRDPNIVIDFD